MPAAKRDGLRLEREVEHGIHVGVAHVGRELHRVGVVDLAEHEEVGLAGCVRVVEHLGRPLLPELEVHVLGGVDAEAVDAEVDPVLVHVDEAVDDGRVLGHEVVEADEVAERDRLPLPRRVAAVVVERRVVEPRRDLEVRVLGRHDRGVREARRRVEGRERLAAVGVVARVERGARGIRVGARGLVDVGVLALGVVDDVGRVVRDDVEVDLDALGVRLGDEGLELGVRAEVRVDLGEVGDPVAVVAGGRVRALALHRAVLEARGQPDGRGAEAVDVVELRAEAGEVAAVVEALVGGVVSGREGVAVEAARVVGGVAVLEAVGHDEVEDLVAAGLAHGVGDERGVGCLVVRAAESGRLETDALQGVVEHDAHGGVAGDRERDVVAAAVQAVRLVPRVVHGDLVLPVSRRDREVGRVDARGAGCGELGLDALGLPVAGAAELGLQGADEGERARFLGRGPGR